MENAFVIMVGIGMIAVNFKLVKKIVMIKAVVLKEFVIVIMDLRGFLVKREVNAKTIVLTEDYVQMEYANAYQDFRDQDANFR